MGPAPEPIQVQIAAPVSNQGQLPAPDPNKGQHQNIVQGGQIPVPISSTTADTSSNTDRPIGDREPQNTCSGPVLHGNLSSGELIINGCIVLV